MCLCIEVCREPLHILLSIIEVGIEINAKSTSQSVAYRSKCTRCAAMPSDVLLQRATGQVTRVARTNAQQSDIHFDRFETDETHAQIQLGTKIQKINQKISKMKRNWNAEMLHLVDRR